MNTIIAITLLFFANTLYAQPKDNPKDALSVIWNEKEHLQKQFSYRNIKSTLDAIGLAGRIADYKSKLLKDSNLSLSDRKQRGEIVLQYLEEALYTLHLRFPKFTELSLHVPEDPTFFQEAKKIIPNATLRNAPIFQGDIILSNTDPSAVSGFIKGSFEFEGGYSHSTIAMIAKDGPSKNNIYAIEALIEDGVKIRPTDDHYDRKGAYKIAIFRYQGSGKIEGRIRVMKEISNAVRLTRNFLYEQVSNPFVETAIPYDFAMRPDDESAWFCSEVPYQIFKKAPSLYKINPYPPSIWSHVRTGAIPFYENILGVQEKQIPTPSDIEFNPAYEPVALFYNLKRIGASRIADSVARNLFLIAENPTSPSASYLPKLMEILRKIQDVDARTAVSELQKLGVLAKSTANQILAKLPQGIGAKQVVFFGFLNEWLTPKIIEKGVKQEQDYFRAQGKVWTRVELDQNVLGLMIQTVEKELSRLK